MYVAINDILVNCIVSMSFILAGMFLVFRNSFNKEEKVFGYFLVLNAVFESIAWCSSTLFSINNNLPGLHAYTFLEFIFVTWYSYKSLPILKERLTAYITFLGSTFIVDNSLTVQNIFTYNSKSVSAVKIFTIVMSILFFYRILATKKYSIIEIRPSVYFFTALFLHSCTSMTWYMYSNEMLDLDRNLSSQLNVIKNSAGLLASLIIFTGVYYIIKRKEDDII